LQEHYEIHYVWYQLYPIPICVRGLFLVSATFTSLFSGYAAENILKVLQGQLIGTLFHKDAHKWAPIKEVNAREMAVAARDCSRRLQVSFIPKHLQDCGY